MGHSQRSFSTLRRVKTWLRSTISDERVSGLCMLRQNDKNGLSWDNIWEAYHEAYLRQTAYHDKMNTNKKQFMEKVIAEYGSDTKRLQLISK